VFSQVRIASVCHRRGPSDPSTARPNNTSLSRKRGSRSPGRAQNLQVVRVKRDGGESLQHLCSLRSREYLSAMHPTLFTRVRIETVRKGSLRNWLGRVPSMRSAYLTDPSDAECAYLQPHHPAPKVGGRTRIHSLRGILDAIFYIARSGCAWRLLPHDFPPCKAVHHYFRIWRIDGTWERLNAGLSSSDELLDGKTLGSLMRLFGQFL